MTLAELQEIGAHKRFFIGNHTCSHVPLSICDDDVVRSEITEAQSILKELTGQTLSRLVTLMGSTMPESVQLPLKRG